MAHAIPYEAPTIAKGPSANEELQSLLETLHQQGLLRILNELLQASPQVAELLLNGMNREDSRNAAQNISLLLMALGRIPPERFALLADGVVGALDGLREGAGDGKAPGVLGALQLLRDDQLWRSLQTLLKALEKLTAPLQQAEQAPAARREQQAEDKPRRHAGANAAAGGAST